MLKSSRVSATHFVEATLAALAGYLYGAARGGTIDAASIGLLVSLIVVTGLLTATARNPTIAAVAGFLPAVLAGVLVSGDPVVELQTPILFSVAVPSAMWAMSVRLADAPSAHTATLYRVANTLVILALGVPVLTGQLHWGIVILPFAFFRISMNCAAKISEARAVIRRIQWFGGAWVAGWAGIVP